MNIPINRCTAMLLLPLITARSAKIISEWQSWDKGMLVYSGIESLSHYLTEHQPTTAKLNTKLAWTIEKIQKCLIVTSAMALIGTVLECINLVDKKFNLIPSDLIFTSDSGLDYVALNATRLAANITCLIGCIGVLTMAWKAVFIINQYFWKKEDASKLLEGLDPSPANQTTQTITYDHPHEDKIHEGILLIRVACSIVSFAMNPTSLLLFSNMALQSYSLLNIAKRKWVNFKVVLSVNFMYGISKVSIINQITLNLFMRIFAANPREEDKECGICIEDIENPSIVNKDTSEGAQGVLCCNKHIFHLKCITTWLYSKANEIGPGLNNFVVYRDKYGDITKYSAQLSSKHLPNCPPCRQAPHYHVEASAKGPDGRSHVLKIAITS